LREEIAVPKIDRYAFFASVIAFVILAIVLFTTSGQV
jgi:hypothetical protein|tara:strand:+ start:299 stop:409 length:111 start_codon:yes stop_codon:yes gene_type:complete